jgi:hypothetical protein
LIAHANPCAIGAAPQEKAMLSIVLFPFFGHHEGCGWGHEGHGHWGHHHCR